MMVPRGGYAVILIGILFVIGAAAHTQQQQMHHQELRRSPPTVTHTNSHVEYVAPSARRLHSVRRLSAVSPMDEVGIDPSLLPDPALPSPSPSPSPPSAPSTPKRYKPTNTRTTNAKGRTGARAPTNGPTKSARVSGAPSVSKPPSNKQVPTAAPTKSARAARSTPTPPSVSAEIDAVPRSRGVVAPSGFERAPSDSAIVDPIDTDRTHTPNQPNQQNEKNNQEEEETILNANRIATPPATPSTPSSNINKSKKKATGSSVERSSSSSSPSRPSQMRSDAANAVSEIIAAAPLQVFSPPPSSPSPPKIAPASQRPNRSVRPITNPNQNQNQNPPSPPPSNTNKSTGSATRPNPATVEQRAREAMRQRQQRARANQLKQPKLPPPESPSVDNIPVDSLLEPFIHPDANEVVLTPSSPPLPLAIESVEPIIDPRRSSSSSSSPPTPTKTPIVVESTTPLGFNTDEIASEGSAQAKPPLMRQKGTLRRGPDADAAVTVAAGAVDSADGQSRSRDPSSVVVDAATIVAGELASNMPSDRFFTPVFTESLEQDDTRTRTPKEADTPTTPTSTPTDTTPTSASLPALLSVTPSQLSIDLLAKEKLHQDILAQLRQTQEEVAQLQVENREANTNQPNKQPNDRDIPSSPASSSDSNAHDSVRPFQIGGVVTSMVADEPTSATTPSRTITLPPQESMEAPTTNNNVNTADEPKPTYNTSPRPTGDVLEFVPPPPSPTSVKPASPTRPVVAELPTTSNALLRPIPPVLSTALPPASTRVEPVDPTRIAHSNLPLPDRLEEPTSVEVVQLNTPNDDDEEEEPVATLKPRPTSAEIEAGFAPAATRTSQQPAAALNDDVNVPLSTPEPMKPFIPPIVPSDAPAPPPSPSPLSSAPAPPDDDDSASPATVNDPLGGNIEEPSATTPTHTDTPTPTHAPIPASDTDTPVSPFSPDTQWKSVGPPRSSGHSGLVIMVVLFSFLLFVGMKLKRCLAASEYVADGGDGDLENGTLLHGVGGSKKPVVIQPGSGRVVMDLLTDEEDPEEAYQKKRLQQQQQQHQSHDAVTPPARGMSLKSGPSKPQRGTSNKKTKLGLGAKVIEEDD